MKPQKHIASQLGAMPGGEPQGKAPSIGRPRGSSADYNGNNTWYFNGTNGCFNNNNRYNSNFRSRPVLDYDQYDNRLLEDYPVPLSWWLMLSLQASKGKHGKPTYVRFRLHRIERLVCIAHEVGNCELMPTESTAHIIFEPRVREIVCASASKRVVQTFYVQMLQPYLERYFYHPDSYSCRVGKGSLRAVQQLQEYIYEATQGYTTDCHIAKLDIQAFFMSLDCHDICRVISDFVKKHFDGSPYLDTMLYLTRQIYLAATQDHLRDMATPAERALLDPRKSLYNQPYYQGVPIGDWTSQTAGLIKTTAVIVYIVSLGYSLVHYTDDSAVVVVDRERWLREDVWRIERFYASQGLTLHPRKRYFQHHSKGVELLGYKVRFGRILVSSRIYHNIWWYLERVIRRAEDAGWLLAMKEKVLSSLNSYLGMLRHVSGHRLRKAICRQVEQSALGRVFVSAPDYTKIAIRRRYSDAWLYRKEYKQIKSNLKISLQ